VLSVRRADLFEALHGAGTPMVGAGTEIALLMERWRQARIARVNRADLGRRHRQIADHRGVA
jgi:hypothetical protein